jgi:hypothetical protein
MVTIQVVAGLLKDGWSQMSQSRWQAVTVGVTVVLGAATSLVTNLVTDGWPVVLVAVLVALVALNVLFAVLPVRLFAATAGSGRRPRLVRQRARASGAGVVVQVAGDVVVPRPEPPMDGGSGRGGPAA